MINQVSARQTQVQRIAQRIEYALSLFRYVALIEWFVLLAPTWLAYMVGWGMVGAFWCIIASGALFNGAIARKEYHEHNIIQ